MNTRWIATCTVWFVLFALGACGKEAEQPPPPPPPEQSPGLPPPPPGATPDPPTEPTADEIPVAEDFELEVAEQITPDNYMAELDAIEKELDSMK